MKRFLTILAVAVLQHVSFADATDSGSCNCLGFLMPENSQPALSSLIYYDMEFVNNCTESLAQKDCNDRCLNVVQLVTGIQVQTVLPGMNSADVICLMLNGNADNGEVYAYTKFCGGEMEFVWKSHVPKICCRKGVSVGC